MTTTPYTAEMRDVRDRIPKAVRDACAYLGYIGDDGLTSPAAVADCAMDLLADWTCYLTPAQFDVAYVAITRHVYMTFALDSGASDGTDLYGSDLRFVADGGTIVHRRTRADVGQADRMEATIR